MQRGVCRLPQCDSRPFLFTPLDSYIFANTGCDGEHFALLTDFGLQEDLDHAPVIGVFPMNLDATRNVRIVARNIRDFLWLQLNHEMLLVSDFDNEEEYAEHCKKESEDKSTDYFDHGLWLEQKELVKKSAQDRFNFPEIIHPYRYIQEIRAERSKKVVLRTRDTLGILPLQNNIGVNPHPWAQRRGLPGDLSNQLESFFESALLETKLAFIRDYQAECTQDSNSLLMICEELERNEFHREAKMIRACMDI
ncbi:hypothetical protein ACTID9_22410 [Brevibacillus fluminis]|uniref:hypothetical protein n=1 Tax=Brevibacillus fluminis TaxID=511487 RepID=UPI003F8A4259